MSEDDELTDPGGRPRKEVDAEDLRRLAGMQSTHAEMAAWFGMCPRTFQSRLSESEELREIIAIGKEFGKASLRRLQFKLAQTNVAMAIFLGKNYLGQTDKVDHEHGGKDGGPIPIALVRRVIVDPRAEDPDAHDRDTASVPPAPGAEEV